MPPRRGRTGLRSVLSGFLLLWACARVPGSNGPEVYGTGVFTTGEWDFFVALSPGQDEAFLCRADSTFSRYRILETHREGQRWSPPVPPAFAGRWSDADPHFAPGGHRLYFVSNRPHDGSETPQDSYDIWYVERRTGKTWSDPVRVAEPVSLPGSDEWSPSVDASGDLYFGAERPGGHGGMDLWRAPWAGDHWETPVNLGDSINTPADEVEPWIAPDGSYLIFSARHRSDSTGGYDLYRSDRHAGIWQRPVPLAAVNTRWSEFNQSVSPDGVWLYFSSTRPRADSAAFGGRGNGLGDIYRIRLNHLPR